MKIGKCENFSNFQQFSSIFAKNKYDLLIFQTQHYCMKEFSTIMTIAILLVGSLLASAVPPESEKARRLHNYLANNPEYAKTLTGMKTLRTTRRPVVGIATHRAANEFAPENTLAAMQIALDLEADFIEIDIRQTRDGRSLILHDVNLDRTTTGKGPVKAISFDEARKLSAGRWFDPFFAEEKIPTLEASCRLISDHNKNGGHPAYFYIDCKDINVRVLIDTLTEYNLLEGSVFYVNEQQIGQIRQLAPQARLLPGLNDPKDLDRLIDTCHPYALDVNWNDLSKELTDKAHAKGVKIFSDGFGGYQTVESYVKAIKAGIDVISTNKVSVICEAAQVQ